MKLPEHSSSAAVLEGFVRISVQTKKKYISLAEYDGILTTICGFLLIPKCCLVYVGCVENPLTLCWQMSNELSSYVKAVRIDVSSEFMLSEQGIVNLMVGDWINYRCLTIEVL